MTKFHPGQRIDVERDITGVYGRPDRHLSVHGTIASSIRFGRGYRVTLTDGTVHIIPPSPRRRRVYNLAALAPFVPTIESAATSLADGPATAGELGADDLGHLVTIMGFTGYLVAAGPDPIFDGYVTLVVNRTTYTVGPSQPVTFARATAAA